MNLKELASPIRIYWDVMPCPDRQVINYAEICRDIITNKVLSLQISDLAPVLSPACLTIFDTLRDESIALSLTMTLSAAAASTTELLGRLPVRVLFIEASSLRELETISEIQKQLEGKPPVGISFRVDENNWSELPEVLLFCINKRISNLLFPMQRLNEDSKGFYLTAGRQRELASQIRESEKQEWLKIIIHDPFLWRVFYPEVSFPNGGCQAANTMLYVSPEADVFPCPSLPIKIGSLMKESLREVIFSERKIKLRNSLRTAPDGCTACGEVNLCMGGCRGRAYTINKTLNGPDPACGRHHEDPEEDGKRWRVTV